MLESMISLLRRFQSDLHFLANVRAAEKAKVLQNGDDNCDDDNCNDDDTMMMMV